MKMKRVNKNEFVLVMVMSGSFEFSLGKGISVWNVRCLCGLNTHWESELGGNLNLMSYGF